MADRAFFGFDQPAGPDAGVAESLVEFFDSLEQAQGRLEQAMEAADARVRPWQAAIAPGDCFISLAEDGLVVFGEVLEAYPEPRLRHYLFCRCHSAACPEGELGDVHVSTVACRISRQFFEEMRAAGWAMEGPAPASARCVSGETDREEAGMETPPPPTASEAPARGCLRQA